MEEPGKHSIGEYEILEEIDRGAQGSVYKARYVGDTTESLESGQLVALKRMVVEDHYFDRHAAFAGRLQHQNIVRVLDHFLDDSFEERPCIVMEYLDGVTLKEAIQQSGSQAGLAWDHVRDIFYQCIEGFQFAQKEGIVHRDVKPTNIFIINEREAKLIDFGVARQADSESSLGGFRGTLVYMAPDFVKLEDFRGDEQSDVYSLGVCIFEALTGTLPYPELKDCREFDFMNFWTDFKHSTFSLSRWLKSNRSVDKRVSSKIVELNYVLNGFNEFLRKSLSPERKRRYKTFAEMQRALGRIDYKRVQGEDKLYQLIGVLGEGGFGRVYKARLAVNYEEEFAIKELLNARNAKRFRREAELMQAYPHPNIVPCQELIEDSIDGEAALFLVMDFLPGMPGSTLRDRIRNARRHSGGGEGLPPRESMVLARSYLQGLAHLHADGVLHRDIKPANLYAPSGSPDQAMLLDLGIARDSASTMTKAGAPGTLDYMAPEFATRNNFKGTPASDVYSLGVSIYEALTGSPPFPRLSKSTGPPEALFYKRSINATLPDFDAPVFRNDRKLMRIVKKALEPNDKRRYRSGKDMLRDVSAYLDLSLQGEPMPGHMEEDGSTTRASRAVDPGTMPRPEEPGVESKPPAAPRKSADPVPELSRPERIIPPADKPVRPQAPPPPEARARGPGSPGRAAREKSPAHAAQALPPVPKFKQERGARPARSNNMLLVASIILVLVLLAAGTFLGIRISQEKHAEGCLAREMRVKFGISSLSIQGGDMENYLKDLKDLRSEIRVGMGHCPGVGSWPALQHELIPKFRAFAQIWEQEMETMLTAKQYAEAHAALALLDQHRLREFGKATELGWSPEALETTRLEYRAAMQFMTTVGQLSTLDLSSISTIRASNFEMADGAYREVQSFLARDFSAVPVRFINSQVELLADCKIFQQRMERMTLDYLDNLQARLATIAREGSGDISTIDRQINSTVLSTSAILQDSAEVRARQAKLKQHVDALIESSEVKAGPEGALNLLNASSPGGQLLAMLSRPEAHDRIKPGSFEPA